MLPSVPRRPAWLVHQPDPAPHALGLMTVSLPVALVLFVIGAITVLLIVAGLAARRTAFRAGHAGITLGADLRDDIPECARGRC